MFFFSHNNNIYFWSFRYKYGMYPVGHPTIITEDCGGVENYFGLIHCRVIPPRGLYLPVLPYRCQNKLMFPLCRMCAENLQLTPCSHTNDERALIGTWVSEELKLAKKKGYQFTHVSIYLFIMFTSLSHFRMHCLFIK